MEFLSQSKLYPPLCNTKYATHSSNGSQFPQIKSKNEDIMRRNLTDFYPHIKTLRRSYTTLMSPMPSAQSVRKSDSISAFPQYLNDLEGLRVPDIFSTSRNSLYTRYTVNDWIKSSQRIYANSDNCKFVSEKIRGDSLRLGRECDDGINICQGDSHKKIGGRISDVNFINSNLEEEIKEMISETDKLTFAKSLVQKALAETENPLHISQQCIYNREKRSGIDLVHDNVEKDLLKELDIIQICQHKMSDIINKVGEQLRLNKSIQSFLEKDTRDKYHALKADELAFSLKNSSPGLAFHKDVEFTNNCISTPETWLKFSTRNLEESHHERDASQKLRQEIEFLLKQCQEDIVKQWNEVNSSMSRRLQEEIDARNKDQAHLQQLSREIFDSEKNIEYIKKTILDKDAPLKLAESRLQVRLERPNMEACNDEPRNRLIQEVNQIKTSIAHLQKQLRAAETSLQNLILNKTDVEADIRVKLNSIFIDREQCLGLRKTFLII